MVVGWEGKKARRREGGRKDTNYSTMHLIAFAEMKRRACVRALKVALVHLSIGASISDIDAFITSVDSCDKAS